MYKKFTEEDLSKIKSALKDLTGVGFTIYDRDQPDTNLDGESLTERQAFFVNAKLWKVIEAIIVNLYLDKLIKRELFFKIGGDKYTVTLYKGERK